MDKTFLKDKIYESMKLDKPEKKRLKESVEVTFCPICGAHDDDIDFLEGYDGKISLEKIICHNCGYTGDSTDFFIDGRFTVSDAINQIRKRSCYSESLKEEYYPFTFYDEEYNLVPLKTTYNNNGTLAIMVYTDDGEPFGDLTVNLPASDILADDIHAFVQRDSWVKDFIKQTKIGNPAGKSAKSGFSTFELYEFDINKLDDM